MAKWQALADVARRFASSRGRDASFWLDKACIDQANISDGLRVLPINVMCCAGMLMLCGKTYQHRLVYLGAVHPDGLYGHGQHRRAAPRGARR